MGHIEPCNFTNRFRVDFDGDHDGLLTHAVRRVNRHWNVEDGFALEIDFQDSASMSVRRELDAAAAEGFGTVKITLLDNADKMLSSELYSDVTIYSMSETLDYGVAKPIILTVVFAVGANEGREDHV